MIIIIAVSLLLIAAYMARGFKTMIGLSAVRSVIMGLVLSVPIVICLVSEVVNFVASSSLKVGCLLGGMELGEIQHMYFKRMASELLSQQRGDESEDQDQ